MKRSLLFALFAILLSNVNAQVQLSWDRTFVQAGEPRYGNLAVDNSGNAWITGTFAESTTSGAPTNVYIVKYNAAGTQSINLSYGATGTYDEPGDIACDGAGNVFVCGRSYGVNGINNLFLRKYSTSGALLFSTTYNTPQNYSEYAVAMALDAAGNIYVGGHVLKAEPSSYDYLTVKFNSSGFYQWHQLYNGTANGIDMAADLAVDAAGNVYITGASEGQINVSNTIVSTKSDYTTIKYNSAGVQQWVSRYSYQTTNCDDQAHALAVDQSGNVYVTGESTVTGSQNSDCVTIKYNSAGMQQWASVFAGQAAANDYAADVHVDGSGNVFIGGAVSNSGTGLDLLAVKYNSLGTQQWARNYDAANSEIGIKAGMDANGSFYLTGHSFSYGGRNADFVTAKWAANGVREWAVKFSSPGQLNDKPADLVVYTPASSPGQVVTPQVYITGSNDDLLTVKYTQPPVNGLASVVEPLPNGYAVGNHPNPFKSSTNISYNLPEAGHVTINVFDMMGRRVSTLVDGDRSAGSYVQRFTAGKSPGGVYFYQFVVKSKTTEVNTTRSMMRQK